MILVHDGVTLARTVLPLECDILRIVPYLKLKLISRIAAHDSMVTGKPQWFTLHGVWRKGGHPLKCKDHCYFYNCCPMQSLPGHSLFLCRYHFTNYAILSSCWCLALACLLSCIWGWLACYPLPTHTHFLLTKKTIPCFQMELYIKKEKNLFSVSLHLAAKKQENEGWDHAE